MNEQTLSLLFNFIKQTQSKRIKANQIPKFEYNEQAALDWARFTQEEAGEIVAEFQCRKPWKDYKPVNKEKALVKCADTLIQLAHTVMYLGYSGEDLFNAVVSKMNTKREDWRKVN